MVDFDRLRIGFVTLTVGHWDLMADCMRSIYECYPHPKEIYIIPNLDYKMSVSAALNKGFKRAMAEHCDYIVYVADDVIVRGDDIQRMLTSLIENDLWVKLFNLGFAFFAVNPEVFKHVGYWDEGFYPAYFEDNDWQYRIILKDPSKISGSIHESEDIAQSIHIGSATLKRMTPEEQERHHENFRRNRDRYIRKWGGEPLHEVYTVPWNGDPPPEERWLV
jgi:hypothetical protein